MPTMPVFTFGENTYNYQYRVFDNDATDAYFRFRRDAESTAKYNACAVYDLVNNYMICDYREVDE